MNVETVQPCSGRVDGPTDAEPQIYPQESADEDGDQNQPRPLVRNRNEHGVSRRDIDPDALKVLYRLSRNHFTAYLVGGGVRDLLLGRKPKDFDVSTDARPEQIRTLFRNCILIGRRFRLAHIRYGDKIIETSTFRRTPETAADPNDPDADLFQRDDNLFGTPMEDALRRDFTVNGLFYDIDSFSIIDYVGGMEDLAARRIRSIGDPCIRFREDPVRMVRAVRFASRLDFDFDPDTLDAIHRHGDEITKAAPARLLEEIIRLFAFSAGEKAIGLLHATGLLKIILPEVAACLDHPKTDISRFWNRLRALDNGDTVMPEATPALIFASLLTDALHLSLLRDHRGGTPPRLRYDKARSFIEPVAARLRFPKKLTERIVHIFMSQHRFNAHGAKRGSLAGFVTQDWFHESLALAEINLTASGGDQATLNSWRDMLAERIYGKEEPREDRHVGRNGGENGDGHAEAEEAAEPDQSGKKLSRSARRRRNKQRNKLRRLEEARGQSQTGPDASEAAAVPLARADADTERRPAARAEAIAVQPKAAPPAAADAVEEKTEKQREKPGKTKNRRERKKAPAKRQAAPAEAKPAGDEPAGAPIPPPLTAAAFYAADPEKPKQKSEAKRKAPAKDETKKKGEKRNRGEQPDNTKPLLMDKADEAAQPMHWLDEVDFL